MVASITKMFLQYNSNHNHITPENVVNIIWLLNSARKKFWSETGRLWSLLQEELVVVGVQRGREAVPVQLVPSHRLVTHHSRMQQMISECLLVVPDTACSMF
jgi:hypothetical protein